MRQNKRFCVVRSGTVVLAGWILTVAAFSCDRKPSAPVTAAPATQEGQVLVPPTVPTALYIGTPAQIKNTTAVISNVKRQFYAPPGTVNVALKRPVTAGGDLSMGDLKMVTDGDRSGTEGTVAEIEDGCRWVQIDLGQPVDVHAIVVWRNFGDPRVYRDVIVQVSDDPKFQDGVKTLFNNDNDNSSGLGTGSDREVLETNEGHLIDAKGTRARYVRLYSKGNTEDDMNHYVEVEVYGIPMK